MEKAFLDFVMVVKGTHHGIGSIKDARKAWAAVESVGKVESLHEATLADTYYDQVLQTKHILLAFAGSGDKEARSLHDRFVKRFGILKSAPRGITNRFERFLKGVTYFQGESDGAMPVYHRFAACGKIGTQDGLFCLDGLPRNQLKARKVRVETCYIERCIYDEIYTHDALLFTGKGDDKFESLQDQAHIEYLKIIREEYSRCFRGYTLDVEVGFDENMIPAMPVAVVIRKFYKGRLVQEESYKKEIANISTKEYDMVVVCRKHDYKNNKVYAKVQRFESPQDWKVVQKNA